MEFKLSKESLLKVSLGSALFALIMGVMAISVTLFCRVAGGQDYLDLYYWSLSAHGLSMLVLWVPSIVAYFYINQNKEILENKKMTSFIHDPEQDTWAWNKAKYEEVEEILDLIAANY